MCHSENFVSLTHGTSVKRWSISAVVSAELDWFSQYICFKEHSWPHKEGSDGLLYGLTAPPSPLVSLVLQDRCSLLLIRYVTWFTWIYSLKYLRDRRVNWCQSWSNLQQWWTASGGHLSTSRTTLTSMDWRSGRKRCRESSTTTWNRSATAFSAPRLINITWDCISYWLLLNVCCVKKKHL